MGRVFLKLVIVLLMLMSFSCKRYQEPIGGAQKASTDLPASEQIASVSALPGDGSIAELSNVQEVKFSPEQLFVQTCSACHQITGKGIPAAFPPLDGSPYVQSDKTERMASIMLYGLVGPIKVLGAEFNSAMAPLGTTNDDQTLAAIASYVRSAWSNKAAPVGPEVFANMRKKWGSRGPFNIQELGAEE